MPTYICHGFRWPRPLIRIHIILQNLEDAAAEWLMAPATTATLLDNFNTLYPDVMSALSNPLAFIEQYDPVDERAESKSQPYAYVCDIVHEVKLSVDVDEVRGKGVSNEEWNAIMELRDSIAPDEKVGWYVVVCGDTERWAPPVGGLESSTSSGSTRGGARHASSPSTGNTHEKRPSTAKGFKKLLGIRDKKSDDEPPTPIDTSVGDRASKVPSEPSAPAPS